MGNGITKKELEQLLDERNAKYEALRKARRIRTSNIVGYGSVIAAGILFLLVGYKLAVSVFLLANSQLPQASLDLYDTLIMTFLGIGISILGYKFVINHIDDLIKAIQTKVS